MAGEGIPKDAENARLSLVAAFVDALFGVPVLTVLSILIVLFPFASHDLLEQQLLPLPGVKPFLLFAGYLILVAIHRQKRTYGVPRVAGRFAVVLVALFSVAIARSISSGVVEIVDSGFDTFHYLLSFYIKPLIYFLPFVFILWFVEDEREIEKVLKAMGIAVGALSVYLMYLYAFHLTAAQRANFELVRTYFIQTIGINTNIIACFYSVVFPVMMAFFLRKPGFRTAAVLVLYAIGVSLLYSRAAYGSVLLSVVMLLGMTRRWKILAVAAVAFIGFIPFIPEDVRNRAVTGISGNAVDIAALSAGRVPLLWEPLGAEMLNDPEKLAVGMGRYGITVSDSYRAGRTLQVTHPHNMYLELALDLGLIGLVLVAAYFIRIMRYVLDRSRRSEPARRMDDISAGLFVAVIAFLVSGLTGRTFFPSHENVFFWIVLACIIRIRLLRRGSHQ